MHVTLRGRKDGSQVHACPQATEDVLRLGLG